MRLTLLCAPASMTESAGAVTRTISEVGQLFEICTTAIGAYPSRDSGMARALALDRGLINRDPAALHKARALARVNLSKRRLGL